jgi:predicted RNA-binding Zn-ribbon protein involved in translation (DUF1610 family)
MPAPSTTYSTSWVDFLPLALIFFSAVLIFLAGRTKKLKCPDCGTVFNAPAMDNKRSGLGWTLPYLGVVKCPNCGEKRSRRDYQKVKYKEPKFTGTILPEGSASPSPP